MEDFAEGIEGQAGELLSAFAEDAGTVGLEIGKGLLELRRTAAPIGDGVAVNAGCGGGLGEVRAAGQGVEDLGLLSGKIRIVHGANFRLYDSARAGQGRGGRKVGIGCRSMKRWEQKIYRKSVTDPFRSPLVTPATPSQDWPEPVYVSHILKLWRLPIRWTIARGSIGMRPTP